MTSIVMAGGGTAGHTSPLIATAKALLELEPGAEIVCVGTSKGLETRVIPEAGLPLELITPVPLPRRPSQDLVMLPWRLTKSVRQARAVLRRHRADVLVGFGGYVSIPAYLAAASLRVPIVVHEANHLAGISNRIGARLAAHVATTFPETVLPGAHVTGMPMAANITARSTPKAEARSSFGLEPDRATLLVSGGSQGAVRINQTVVEARDALLAAGVQVLHVLGPKNFGADDVVVNHDGGARYVPVPFVADMAAAYAAADLMLARAGAATVMETAVSGLPVVFVPLPWGNGEQARNAAGLVAAGAGILLPEPELTPQRLLAEVVPVITDPARLAGMSRTARNQYPADAAQVLAAAVLDVKRK